MKCEYDQVVKGGFVINRKSSGSESPLIQNTVILPHIILEPVPVYIHAGQYQMFKINHPLNKASDRSSLLC